MRIDRRQQASYSLKTPSKSIAEKACSDFKSWIVKWLYRVRKWFGCPSLTGNQAGLFREMALYYEIGPKRSLREICLVSHMLGLGINFDLAIRALATFIAKPVEQEIDDRGCIKSQQLTDQKAADDGVAEWLA